MSSSGDDELVFMMGKSPVRIPRDRMYSRNHHWIQEGPGGFRVGLTPFAVHSLPEIIFLEWKVEPHSSVKSTQEIGEIESSRGISGLASPATGQLLDFNSMLQDDPSVINSDSYGLGWLYHIETYTRFLSPEDYLKFLHAEWDDTQKKSPASDD